MSVLKKQKSVYVCVWKYERNTCTSVYSNKNKILSYKNFSEARQVAFCAYLLFQIWSITAYSLLLKTMFVNSAGFCLLLWAAAWRARAPVRASAIPSGIGKSLSSFPGLSDLSWLHVAASDLHWRPSPDMEDWRLLMQKPLLIHCIKDCAVWNQPDGCVTVLTSSVSSFLSSTF